uniref:Uncharacterized protein n=1 Tax=Knipowitschia caucasica TaxID=637954 RepID=A0AAV2LAW9_KNICA
MYGYMYVRVAVRFRVYRGLDSRLEVVIFAVLGRWRSGGLFLAEPRCRGIAVHRSHGCSSNRPTDAPRFSPGQAILVVHAVHVRH